MGKPQRRARPDRDCIPLRNKIHPLFYIDSTQWANRKILERICPVSYTHLQTLSYLVRGNDKWVTANYKETQIAHIYIGQKVRIKVDAFSGRTFHGTVTAISEATGSKYSLVDVYKRQHYTISSPVFTTATFSVLWKGMNAAMTAITSASIST